MSKILAIDIARVLCDAAVDVAWSQWAALGAMSSRKRTAVSVSIIDVEALLMISLVLRDSERRLDDLLGWWSAHGVSLLSIQRSRNIASRFSPAHARRLGDFARLAVDQGDRRWHQIAKAESSAALRPRPQKSFHGIALSRQSALMPRLRAGFGVGAKADLLCLLIGSHGRALSIPEAAEALSYTTEALRVAAQEMLLAGFIESVGNQKKTRYKADVAMWATVIHGTSASDRTKPSAAKWVNWAGVFPLVADLIELGEQALAKKWSDYVQLSHLRDLMEKHHAAFVSALGFAPEKYLSPDSDASTIMRSFATQWAQWMRTNA